ncbi:hypothetical protein TRVL_09341 [Trypanosoma vivax]|nr:hypothetical protein TRVL_09341 [Trypanosoma vivax]
MVEHKVASTFIEIQNQNGTERRELNQEQKTTTVHPTCSCTHKLLGQTTGKEKERITTAVRQYVVKHTLVLFPLRLYTNISRALRAVKTMPNTSPALVQKATRGPTCGKATHSWKVS